MTRDPDIRAAVLAILRSDPTTWVREEVGCGAAIADIAFMVDDRLCATEIKSDVDSLTRLPWQVQSYGYVFDRVTLACGARHYDRAVAIIPPWWGVLLARKHADGAVELDPIRGATDNPGVAWWALVGMLWRDELRAVLVRRGIAKGALGSKAKMGDRLKEHVSLDELRAEVRAALRARDWDAGSMAEAKMAAKGRG